MKLISLELLNFRQHRKSKICFAAGLTAIIGANGSGKSTLMEAIAFALYGSQALRGKVEEVRTRGAEKGQTAWATLCFEHDGASFKVERGLERAFLYQGGQETPITSGLNEVTQRLQGLLGMKYEEFAATYFTEQKGVEFLAGLSGAAERERFIVRLLGYAKLERAQELLREERRDKRNAIQGAEAGLGQVSEIELRRSEEKDLLEQALKLQSEAQAALKRLESDNTASKDRLAKLDQERSSVEKLQALGREISIRLQEKKALSLKLKERKEAKSTALAARGLEQGDAALVEKNLAEVVAQQEISQKALQQLENLWREKKAQAQAALNSVDTRLKELNSRQAELGAVTAEKVCPTCGQALGENFRQVAEHFAAEVRDLRQQKEYLKEALVLLSSPPAEISCRAAQLQELQSQGQALQAKIQGLKEHQAAKRELEEIAQEEAELLGQIQKLEQELLRHQPSPKQLEMQQQYQSQKIAYDAETRLVEVARLQAVRAEGEAKKHAALLERIESELKLYADRSAALQAQRQRLLLLEESDKVLSDFRKYLNASIRPRLEDLSSEFLADLTDGRYSSVQFDKDFLPSVIEDGSTKPILSGGEEDVLNLCVRLALSQMLAERAGQAFSFLVLDEVFGHLDEQRRQNVLALLDKLALRFEQIVIITHLEDVKEAVNNTLYVSFNEASGEAKVGEVQENYAEGL
jgi:exonuclease SbcC